MEYRMLGRTGLRVSRLSLGTAEIGFEYGIGQRSLPSEYDAMYLLKRAHEFGITYFDTANFYGLAERRIGKSGIAKLNDVVIATKCGQFLEKGEDPRGNELEKKLREQVEASLRNLKVDALSILMLHGGSADQIRRGELIEILEKFKEEGKARFIGISARGEETATAAICSRRFDVIQVAYSILDQRMHQNVFSTAFVDNIGIVNRSVLLKGSLSPLIHQLPSRLELLKENVKIAEEIARQFDMDLPTLAIRFAMSCIAISTSLIGTNNLNHLRSAVDASEAGGLSLDLMKHLEALAIEDPGQVDPIKWLSII